MKLFFPNGEHPQALLSQGLNRIGNARDAQIVLALPDIAAAHCSIDVDGEQATLSPADGAVSVNGKPATTATPIRAGDLLSFAAVQARVVAVEKAAGVAAAPRPAPVDDSGATRVRMAVPKLVLRGVSGAAFGKTYPISGSMVIGRQADCDISIPSEEISRRHAQLKPTPAGLAVEDLGSSNGTYINGKRVQSGLMKPGEELRLDNIRFLLVAPGMEIPGGAAPRPAVAAAAAPAAASGGGKSGLIVGVVIVLAAAAAAGWYFFLR